jgi:hypothetical protein
MKCSQCSKVIPDGFTDCPWCGAAASSSAAATPPSGIPAKSVLHGGNAAPAWSASLLGFAAVVFLNYLATARQFGEVTLENSGYFLGRCLGAYLLPAIAAFAYYKLREKNPSTSTKLFTISTGGSLLSLIALAGMHPAAPVTAAPAAPRAAVNAARDSSPPPAPSSPPTKWDAALRSIYTDIRAFNEQHVSEVSKIDSISVPVYTPESFRDAATIQQILSQLHARLAVAEKFSSLEPVLNKMPDYIQSVDATEAGKKSFLEDFQSSVRKSLGAHKVAADLEHDYLTASLGLYQFALAKQGAYSLREGNLIFRTKELGGEFNRKLYNAQRLRVQFFQSFQAYKNQQNAALAQIGLRPSDLGTRTSGRAPSTR